mgnify:CR=1 FL=1
MIFIVAIVALIIVVSISYFAAKSFWEIAQMKGHPDSKY